MTFTGITTHPLLSADARALPADELGAHVEQAEILLEVSAADVPEGQMARARLMIVHQVNWQVAMGEDGFFLKSRTVGPLSRQYRDATLISPQAAEIRGALFPAASEAGLPAGPDHVNGYRIIRSLR